jgi:hypothetical protein
LFNENVLERCFVLSGDMTDFNVKLLGCLFSTLGDEIDDRSAVWNTIPGPLETDRPWDLKLLSPNDNVGLARCPIESDGRSTLPIDAKFRDENPSNPRDTDGPDRTASPPLAPPNDPPSVLAIFFLVV